MILVLSALATTNGIISPNGLSYIISFNYLCMSPTIIRHYYAFWPGYPSIRSLFVRMSLDLSPCPGPESCIERVVWCRGFWVHCSILVLGDTSARTVVGVPWTIECMRCTTLCVHFPIFPWHGWALRSVHTAHIKGILIVSFETRSNVQVCWPLWCWDMHCHIGNHHLPHHCIRITVWVVDIVHLWFLG